MEELISKTFDISVRIAFFRDIHTYTVHTSSECLRSQCLKFCGCTVLWGCDYIEVITGYFIQWGQVLKKGLTIVKWRFTSSHMNTTGLSSIFFSVDQLIDKSFCLYTNTLLFLWSFLKVSLSSTLTQRFRPPTMDLFTDTLQSECNRKYQFCISVWLSSCDLFLIIMTYDLAYTIIHFCGVIK